MPGSNTEDTNRSTKLEQLVQDGSLKSEGIQNQQPASKKENSDSLKDVKQDIFKDQKFVLQQYGEQQQQSTPVYDYQNNKQEKDISQEKHCHIRDIERMVYESNKDNYPIFKNQKRQTNNIESEKNEVEVSLDVQRMIYESYNDHSPIFHKLHRKSSEKIHEIQQILEQKGQLLKTNQDIQQENFQEPTHENQDNKNLERNYEKVFDKEFVPQDRRLKPDLVKEPVTPFLDTKSQDHPIELIPHPIKKALQNRGSQIERINSSDQVAESPLEEQQGKQQLFDMRYVLVKDVVSLAEKTFFSKENQKAGFRQKIKQQPQEQVENQEQIKPNQEKHAQIKQKVNKNPPKNTAEHQKQPIMLKNDKKDFQDSTTQKITQEMKKPAQKAQVTPKKHVKETVITPCNINSDQLALDIVPQNQDQDQTQEKKDKMLIRNQKNRAKRAAKKLNKNTQKLTEDQPSLNDEKKEQPLYDQQDITHSQDGFYQSSYRPIYVVKGSQQKIDTSNEQTVQNFGDEIKEQNSEFKVKQQSQQNMYHDGQFNDDSSQNIEDTQQQPRLQRISMKDIKKDLESYGYRYPWFNKTRKSRKNLSHQGENFQDEQGK